MAKTLATLDSAGWVKDMALTVDRQLAYFFVCERNKSYAFREHIHSLPDLIKQFQHDSNLLKEETNRALSNIFTRYFEVVRPNVRIIKEDGSDSYGLQIDLIVGDGEYKYSTARLIDVVDSKLVKIIDINNRGSGQ